MGPFFGTAPLYSWVAWRSFCSHRWFRIGSGHSPCPRNVCGMSRKHKFYITKYLDTIYPLGYHSLCVPKTVSIFVPFKKHCYMLAGTIPFQKKDPYSTVNPLNHHCDLCWIFFMLATKCINPLRSVQMNLEIGRKRLKRMWYPLELLKNLKHQWHGWMC